jgi:hypothetical protein
MSTSRTGSLACSSGRKRIPTQSAEHRSSTRYSRSSPRKTALAVHMEGRFKTKGVYRWGQYASRNLGKWWAVDGDAEVAIDPDAITDVDSQPLYCLAGPAQFVGGLTTIGNHSALADRWKAARQTLRTGSVVIEGDGAIERVTMRNFGALGLESFIAVVSAARARAASRSACSPTGTRRRRTRRSRCS